MLHCMADFSAAFIEYHIFVLSVRTDWVTACERSQVVGRHCVTLTKSSFVVDYLKLESHLASLIPVLFNLCAPFNGA